EDFFVQPAAGDAGTALGAAQYVWHEVLGHERTFTMDHAYWGPGYDESRLRETARALAAGAIVGWFQGRTEWGPRALGNRSILGDPRRPETKEVLNARIKRR